MKDFSHPWIDVRWLIQVNWTYLRLSLGSNLEYTLKKTVRNDKQTGAPLVLVITFWSPILQLSYVILFILPFTISIFLVYHFPEY